MSPVFEAFLDELEKISAARVALFSPARMRQFSARMKGRHRARVRPRKATTVIRQNTLKHKLGEYTPTMGNASTPNPQEVLPRSPNRKKGDVPSREEMEAEPSRQDGRGNATTLYAPGSQQNPADATNSPAGNN